MTSSFIPDQTNLVSPGIHKTKIDGLYYLPHQKHSDERGFYAELYRIPELEAVTGSVFSMKQINLSYSLPNVIRGFHAESWNKLLTIIEGVCFCAWADIRPQSPSFGQVVTMQIGKAESNLFGSVYVAAGIANSFCVVEGPASYLYAVDRLYAERDPKGDTAISLFDPDLAVPWPIPVEQLIYSERDKNAVNMRSLFPEKYA